MSRIPTPATIEATPAASQPLLQAVKKQLGIAPNLFYCLSSHTYLGRHVAKLEDAENTANRHGSSNDIKADAAVKFAAKVTKLRGHVTGADFAAVKAAGYTDAQIIEIVQHVALNTWTNYINTVGETEIDFPLIKAPKVA